MEELIECDNITLGYDGQSIVENLSFSIKKGDYLCVVGDNGSGKTTFIKTLLGLIPPVKGKINFKNGFNQKEIGYLPQIKEAQKDFPSSVMEVVLSGCLNRHKIAFRYTKEEKNNAKEILKRLGMIKEERSSYQELSGGQQQKVLLSRALMATDSLLLLDEPVTGLDIKSSSELYKILKDLNSKGITIIMVTHDIHPAINDANLILHFSHSSYFFGNKTEYFSTKEGKEFLHQAGHDEYSC